MEMETEIQQLVSMGFPSDIAAQSLAACGGDLLKATDWLLNHPPPNSLTQTPPPPFTSTPPIIQPKINQFFHHHHTKIHQNQTPSQQTHRENEEDESPIFFHRNKRQKSAENLENTQKPSAAAHASLSERMRPRVLNEVVGQDHLLGKDSLLRSAIAGGRLPSVVLWGPPGTGKTTIAKAIVSSSADEPSPYNFISLSAVTSGVKDVRDAVETAKKSKLKKPNNKRTVLFLDEVHRFNKSQQDSLLPVIEDGSIIFIGATTENPSFHLITPLLSRCTVLTLNPLKPDHIKTLLNRSISNPDNGLPRLQADDESLDFLSLHCDGDARVALNALEIAATRFNFDPKSNPLLTIKDVKEALQCKHISYDRGGEEHYNIISALHKSMRGSDPNASIYWLARMLEGGEDPLYIARRLIRFASEDVGLADPQALAQAVSCYQACHFIGMPECNVVLAQCVCYLALANKSVSIYRAIEFAQKVVRESVGGNEGVPLHLRNAPTKLMKDLGYGRGYIYPPDDTESRLQSYLPPSLQGYKFLHWP